MRRYKLLAGAAALAISLLATYAAANAAVVQVLATQQLSSTPISFTLGSGSFSFTLDAAGIGNGPQSFIQSNSTGLVTTIFGGVADFESGAPIDGSGNGGFSFAAYPTPTSIPNSSALDFVGFSYQGTGGTHYGYAEVFGNTFVGYAYEDAANTTILTQAVPEPASAALLIGGLAMVGAARRKKRGERRELVA